MTFADPIVGETRTKVGERYTSEKNFIDPIVGQTKTKVGETYTKVNDYATPSFGTCHSAFVPTTTTYYSSYPKRYTHIGVGESLVAAAIFGFIVISALALIPSTANYSRPLRGSFFSPSPSSSYSRAYRYPSFQRAYNPFFSQQFWKCDDIEVCNQHLSGIRSGCHIQKENCHLIYL